VIGDDAAAAPRLVAPRSRPVLRSTAQNVPHPTVARSYARFVLGLALDDLPPPVVARAALCDNAALAVSDERASRIVSDTTRLATLPHLTGLMESLTA